LDSCRFDALMSRYFFTTVRKTNLDCRNNRVRFSTFSH
jgi:hypothetical protein